MLEKIALAAIALGTVYYFYRVIFKRKGCNCGGKDGSCSNKK